MRLPPPGGNVIDGTGEARENYVWLLERLEELGEGDEDRYGTCTRCTDRAANRLAGRAS